MATTIGGCKSRLIMSGLCPVKITAWCKDGEPFFDIGKSQKRGNRRTANMECKRECIPLPRSFPLLSMKNILSRLLVFDTTTAFLWEDGGEEMRFKIKSGLG